MNAAGRVGADPRDGAGDPLQQVDGMDRTQMRTLADSLRNKWKSAVVVLASPEDGAVSIVAAVTKDAIISPIPSWVTFQPAVRT